MDPELDFGRQARSHGVANATPQQQDARFWPPLEIFNNFFTVAVSFYLTIDILKFWLSSALVFVTY